jgi:hypothetical protein
MQLNVPAESLPALAVHRHNEPARQMQNHASDICTAKKRKITEKWHKETALRSCFWSFCQVTGRAIRQ